MMENKKKKSNNNENIKIAILILLIIIVASAGILFYFIKNDSEIKNTDTDVGEKVNKNELAVKINAVLNFENYISNNPGIENQKINNYDITITIYIDGETSPIYKSNRISPGDVINKIKLSKRIKKGKYKAIAYFNAYEGSTYKGKSGVEIILNVK